LPPEDPPEELELLLELELEDDELELLDELLLELDDDELEELLLGVAEASAESVLVSTLFTAATL